MSVCPTVPVNVARNQKAVATVSFTNTGTIAYNFYIAIIIGDYDPATNSFTAEYGVISTPIPLEPGQTKDANVEWFIPADAKTGLRDVIMGICDYDPSTGNVTNVFDAVLCQDVLNVT